MTGSDHVWATAVPNPNEPNSSLTYYIHFGSTTDPRLRVLAALIIQIMSEPAFNILRTREQLGYIVFCTPWSLTGDAETGMRIVIQSERVPTYLEQRVEAFLDEMKTKLEGFTEEEFEQQKSGLEKRWREAVKNMSEETNRYWPQIDNGYLDFYRSKHYFSGPLLFGTFIFLCLHFRLLHDLFVGLKEQMMRISCRRSPKRIHFHFLWTTFIRRRRQEPRCRCTFVRESLSPNG